ncbi:hypothetical protein M426DRAFT_9387 [Hypoxylon sp. CI-4A]|nr:hypothetical protein M426DRAFT_9387 [Hypoxylon sp. CI-4A]
MSKSSPKHFSSLRNIKVLDSGGYDRDVVGAFLGIPSLTTLEYMGSGSREISVLEPIKTPRVLGIQHLEIDLSNTTVDDISVIMSRSPNLRYLKATFNSDYTSIRPAPEPSFLPEFGEALRTHAASQLEVLHVSLPRLMFSSADTAYCVGSLQELRNLRELTISLEDLIGRATTRGLREGTTSLSGLDAQLPDSLQSIKLKIHLDQLYQSPYVLDQIELLLSSPILTRLRKLSVDFQLSYSNFGPVHYSRDVDDTEWDMPCAIDPFKHDRYDEFSYATIPLDPVYGYMW